MCKCVCSIPPPGPCVTYSGKHCGLDVHVVWSGHDTEHNVDLIGTVPASLAAYLACQTFNPDLIISAGTAGGFKARVSRGTMGSWAVHAWAAAWLGTSGRGRIVPESSKRPAQLPAPG